jgi:hypothetical protein
MVSSRTDFNESWLAEMPSGLGTMGDGIFSSIVYAIKDLTSHGKIPSDLGNGFKKIWLTQIAYYWHESGGEIDIGVELQIKSQSLVVSGVGRSANSTVHASDLYNVVLNDNAKSVKLMSDEQLSAQGYDLWKRLLGLGHKITVYDNENPGSTMQTLHTVADMEQFYQFASGKHRRWQYVLSESNEKLAETRSYFNTRRMRELCGMALDDHNGEINGN